MCLLQSLALPAKGGGFLVAPDGSDANPGTKAKPFRTIQRAAEVMRPGDTCSIRGGTYGETVTPAASGREGAPITFQAYDGETVVVTGADPVTAWTRHQGDIWKAPMPWDLGRNNQVFFDGQMLDEARWPNRVKGQLLDPEGAKIDSADTAGLICKALPDGDWTGAVVWALCHSKWTSWTATVTGCDRAAKKLLFPLPEGVRRFHDPARGGEFYLVGRLGLLDAPGEWFHDDAAKRLYLWPPGGADPNQHAVTAKKRLLAFDLQKRSQVQVIGVNVHAATLNLRDADHCLVQGIRATYVSHTRGGNTSYGLNEDSGIVVTGSGNVLRDSEIAFSVGDGVLVGGEHNAIINCWLHDLDYLGCYGTPAKLSGTGHLLSHCTIHDTGRDCIQVSGQAHLIQHNHVYNCGRICHDLGFLYTCANDGGGTEICYNRCHDNLAPGTRCGIYLDNYTSNYLVHHNVVWNTRGDEIRLNKPSQYNLVYNNTLLGGIGNWGRWPTDRMYGDRVQNNLLTGDIKPHPDLLLSHNLANLPAGDEKDYGLGQVRNPSSPEALPPDGVTSDQRPGIDIGIVVPGVTDGFSGAAPDLGAYESGKPPWRAGHDFANPPDPVYRLTQTPFRNRLANGSFDWVASGDAMTPWQRTHAKAAKRIRGQSGITEHQDERDSFIGHAVCLSGDDDDGIEQTVTGLEPNTRYVLAGWLKVGDAGEVRLGVRGYGGEELAKAANGKTWAHVTLEFTTGAKDTSADERRPCAAIFLMKTGSGTAFADDLGVVPAPVGSR
jgi:hypothetical protein